MSLGWGMKITLIIVGCLAFLILAALLFFSYQSKTAPELGLVNGQLRACLYPSHCVNSMVQGEGMIAPISLSKARWLQLPRVIARMEGQLEQHDDHYLWATFRSPLFGFVDDMELLWDEDAGLLHVRASSRVGRSDFSANRKRVEVLREHLLLL